jgi:hypothetical protein
MKKMLITLIVLISLGFNANAKNIIDQGTCGDKLKWALTGNEDNLTLTIKGKGVLQGIKLKIVGKFKAVGLLSM